MIVVCLSGYRRSLTSTWYSHFYGGLQIFYEDVTGKSPKMNRDSPGAWRSSDTIKNASLLVNALLSPADDLKTTVRSYPEVLYPPPSQYAERLTGKTITNSNQTHLFHHAHKDRSRFKL